MKSLNKSIFFITIVIAIVFWVYKGYYPFNVNPGKNVHYLIYDNLHIVFNISNFQYNDKLYYCKSKNKDKIIEINNNIKKYDSEIIKLNKEIANNQVSKYNINEFDYNNIQALYDIAHDTKDNYYVKRANNQERTIKYKLDYNKNLEEAMELQKRSIQYINVLKNIEKQKMLKYCVELL